MAKASLKRRRKDEAFTSGIGEVLPFPVRPKRLKRDKAAATEEPAPHPRPKKEWSCITPAQKRYKQKILSNTITFGIGPAGTGKSFVAAMIAAGLLEDRLIDRIIVTRPAVSDEDYGALPGDLSDKIAPWFAPIQDILIEYFGASHLENLIRLKKVIFVPMGHLRGNTFKNAFILLDEAQNTKPKQLKTLLTRLGVGSRLVVDGDLDQADVPGKNGLEDAMARLRKIDDIAFAHFKTDDIVRHELIKAILKAYSTQDAAAVETETAEE